MQKMDLSCIFFICNFAAKSKPSECVFEPGARKEAILTNSSLCHVSSYFLVCVVKKQKNFERAMVLLVKKIVFQSMFIYTHAKCSFLLIYCSHAVVPVVRGPGRGIDLCWRSESDQRGRRGFPGPSRSRSTGGCAGSQSRTGSSGLFRATLPKLYNLPRG
jgi:hypothetical protein